MSIPKNNFLNNFTRQYALSKTLRFELVPDSKTLEHMRKDLRYDEDIRTFLVDQEIEDAYQYLKPFIDKTHSDFISQSLELASVEPIDFSDYFSNYKNKKDIGESIFAREEKKIRSRISEYFIQTGEQWRKKYSQFDWKKGSSAAVGHEVLLTQDILGLIEEQNNSDDKLRKIIEETFARFFTYFSGFNQNRENYYETKDEKATAIATRIVHENLPKFCDNTIAFEKQKSEYLNAFNYLKNQGNALEDKEKNALTPINGLIFNIDYFNQCLSQEQIDSYNKEIGNANFIVNLYNQAVEKTDLLKLTGFKTLYKQIGCGVSHGFFQITHDFKNEAEIAKKSNPASVSVEEILELAVKAGESYFKASSGSNEIRTVPDFINYIQSQDSYLGFYWSKSAVNTISSKYFSDWGGITEELLNAKVFSKDKNSDNGIKIPEVLELESFFNVVDCLTSEWKVEGVLFKKTFFEDEKKKSIILESSTPSKALLSIIFSDLEYSVNLFLSESAEILKIQKYKDPASIEKIKNWMDSSIAVTRILKYFLVRESKVNGQPFDPELSQGLKNLLESEDAIWYKWYDYLRNYLTKKPQDDVKKNKLKLNFENSTLAKGWDVNKETDNSCVVLKDDSGRKYLAIIKNTNKTVFKKEIVSGRGKLKEVSLNPLFDGDSSGWQKMEYKLLPGPNKMLPKCLLPGSDKKKYGATNEILDIYDKGSFKKNEPNFSPRDLYRMIDFYKSALGKYEDWNCFNFQFKNTELYEDIGQFYSDVARQGYRLNFVPINKNHLDSLVENGQIYLFEIKNQDSNKNKSNNHKDNLHTIYWNAVFEDIQNKPKLNGEAELFYRKAIPVENQELFMDAKGRTTVKNYRFSKEKFLFHVPITLNFSYANEKINSLVNQEYSQSSELHFLGIDRGEKHLAYYSLIDANGKISKQGTLNIELKDNQGNPKIVKKEKKLLDQNGKEKTEIIDCRNYNDLLDVLAGNRDFARKNWQTINTIKDLKEGYISQVVKEIVDITIDRKNPVPVYITLENLSVGFKRGRQKIEKSVYQKMELALAKKLNFLVDKNASSGDVGSVIDALQLTPPVSTFQDIEGKKQFGVMLYTKADYTSQTDPVTGWRKSIYLRSGKEEYVKSQIINAFDDIGFDGKDFYFTYTVDYLDKEKKTSAKQFQKKWILYSGLNGISLDRYRGQKNKNTNQWTINPVDTTKLLHDLFEDFNLDKSIYVQIVDEGLSPKKISPEHTGWESLRYAIEMIQQIRNTGTTEEDTDFILSPVRDSNGGHFDSRKSKTSLPDCGDANGAFNIARKGIIMNEHIKRGISLFISDEEWDTWLAGPQVWGEYLSKNEKKLKKLA